MYHDDKIITVREMQPGDDLNTVLALCKDFFAKYEKHHEEFFDTDSLSDDDIAGLFKDSLTSDRSATIIALDGDVVVGYASVIIREQPRFYKIKKVGAVPALMVAKKYRRRGIATRIMAEAKNFFIRKGVKYFTFYTAVTNRGAVRLYEKLGMETLHVSFLGNSE
ncbi:MAG: GNAT family N-acetyltransferase [Candidatus Zixiibacteriota bacterium]